MQPKTVNCRFLGLSDPNINPAYLATLVFIGSNYKVYMPAKNDIWQRYLRKFSKGGKLLEAELGLASRVQRPRTPMLETHTAHGYLLLQGCVSWVL